MNAAANEFLDLARRFNHAESLIWPAMGLALLVASRWKRGVVRRDFLLAASVLLAFGASDHFEAETGNRWWEPWWLLAWKAGCVLALATIILRAARRQRLAREKTE